MNLRTLVTSLVGYFVLIAGQALAQPPLWIAHGRHSTVYLFGSVHLLPTGVDWAPSRLTAALPEAQEIWFELPIDETTDSAATRLVSARGYLPVGDRLANHLTAEQEVRLKRVSVSLGFEPEIIERMRPWLAEVSLSLAVDERNGAAANRGVEQQLQGMAPTTARRRAFETPSEQINFLAGADLADQVASLDATLREIEDDPQAFARVISEWMGGDLRGLDNDALKPLLKASPVLYRRLILTRNARWSETLERRLRGHGVAIVVVGVAHLIGPQGVPARLRAAGFAVDGP